MTDTTESLRRKLHSGRELRNIVSAMKTLAASNIGQYERAVRSLAEYVRTVEQALSVCLREIEGDGYEPTDKQDIHPSSINAVVFGSDQGLVGRFNEALVEFSLKALGPLPKPQCVVAVGERVARYLEDAGLPPQRQLSVPSGVKSIASLVMDILTEIEKANANGGIHGTVLIYNHPTFSAAYEPRRFRLLPLDDEWLRGLVQSSWPTKVHPEVLGSKETTLPSLLDEYLFVLLFRATAESLMSENACRLVMMQRAEKNIDELLEELSFTYHQLRQSGIDAELFDLIAGFEVINSKR
jgi:F-type H+-transporting ATPase subunit gamma